MSKRSDLCKCGRKMTKIWESDDGYLELYYCDRCKYQSWITYAPPPLWKRVVGSILGLILLTAGVLGAFLLLYVLVIKLYVWLF